MCTTGGRLVVENISAGERSQQQLIPDEKWSHRWHCTFLDKRLPLPRTVLYSTASVGTLSRIRESEGKPSGGEKLAHSAFSPMSQLTPCVSVTQTVFTCRHPIVGEVVRWNVEVEQRWMLLCLLNCPTVRNRHLRTTAW